MNNSSQSRISIKVMDIQLERCFPLQEPQVLGSISICCLWQDTLFFSQCSAASVLAKSPSVLGAVQTEQRGSPSSEHYSLMCNWSKQMGREERMGTYQETEMMWAWAASSARGTSVHVSCAQVVCSTSNDRSQEGLEGG